MRLRHPPQPSVLSSSPLVCATPFDRRFPALLLVTGFFPTPTHLTCARRRARYPSDKTRRRSFVVGDAAASHQTVRAVDTNEAGRHSGRRSGTAVDDTQPADTPSRVRWPGAALACAGPRHEGRRRRLPPPKTPRSGPARRRGGLRPEASRAVGTPPRTQRRVLCHARRGRRRRRGRAIPGR